MPGPAGLSCWDLNGDGEFDAATEDANADGIADALDCRGEPGLPGRACWDLNANGEPDPAEDITGDGTANALDCRGKDAEFSSVFLTTAYTSITTNLRQTLVDDNLKSLAAPCAAGTDLVGGGFAIDNPNVHAWMSGPAGNAWTAATPPGIPHSLSVWALCAGRGIVLGGVP